MFESIPGAKLFLSFITHSNWLSQNNQLFPYLSSASGLILVHSWQQSIQNSELIKTGNNVFQCRNESLTQNIWTAFSVCNYLQLNNTWVSATQVSNWNKRQLKIHYRGIATLSSRVVMVHLFLGMIDALLRLLTFAASQLQHFSASSKVSAADWHKVLDNSQNTDKTQWSGPMETHPEHKSI